MAQVSAVSHAGFFRISGLALLAGAAAFILHLVLRSVITAGADPITLAQGGLWAAINLLGVISAWLVFVGLPATYAWLAASAGILGLTGVALIAFAWMFFGVFLSLYSVLVEPWLAGQAPALIAASAPLPAAILIAFILALAAECAGAVLLAIPFVRGRARPRWIGYVLPAAAIMTLIGDAFLAPGGPASSLAINLLSNSGTVLLLVALGYLGYQMWSENA
jgi:hypothetical protein